MTCILPAVTTSFGALGKVSVKKTVVPTPGLDLSQILPHMTFSIIALHMLCSVSAKIRDSLVRERSSLPALNHCRHNFVLLSCRLARTV